MPHGQAQRSCKASVALSGSCPFGSIAMNDVASNSVSTNFIVYKNVND